MKNSLYLLLSFVLFGCATEEELVPSPSNADHLNPDLIYGNITDCSGNTYATIEIGNQEWMAENLRTTCYANGDPIPNVTDDIQWENLTTGAWAHYDNDSQYENPYGKLYNWYTVNDSRNVCPTGWHVPSDAEWTLLSDYLGGHLVAGGKMKSAGTQYWWNDDPNATNESGFSGLPGGNRGSGGDFYVLGQVGYWWSSSYADSNALIVWSRGLSGGIGGIGGIGGELVIAQDEVEGGEAIRCIKD